MSTGIIKEGKYKKVSGFNTKVDMRQYTISFTGLSGGVAKTGTIPYVIPGVYLASWTLSSQSVSWQRVYNYSSQSNGGYIDGSSGSYTWDLVPVLVETAGPLNVTCKFGGTAANVVNGSATLTLTRINDPTEIIIV